MNVPSVGPSTMVPFADVGGKLTESAPGPLSPFLTLSFTSTCGVDGPDGATTNCVPPTPPLYVSLSATGRTEIDVLSVPWHPKLSVAVITTAPFNTVLVAVPETTPVLGSIARPAGSPVAPHVNVDPVLPDMLKSTGP